MKVLKAKSYVRALTDSDIITKCAPTSFISFESAVILALKANDSGDILGYRVTEQGIEILHKQ